MMQGSNEGKYIGIFTTIIFFLPTAETSMERFFYNLHFPYLSSFDFIFLTHSIWFFCTSQHEKKTEKEKNNGYNDDGNKRKLSKADFTD